MGTALILAGHGSHIRADTAGIIWRCVDTLRLWGIADEVTACFWKEQPAFSTVLNTISSETVIVVPMFTAQGFFTQQVLPAEMGLTGAITQQGSRTIHLMQPLGDHPYIQTIIRQRVDDALAQHSLTPQQTAVAVIGHGTPRNPASQTAAREQADALRAVSPVAEVVVAYLDAAPEIPTIYERTSARTIIAVPYFLATGSHTTIDVPDALGLDAGETTGFINGRTVIYTPPVGADASLAELVLALARDTGLPLEKTAASTWDGFPQAGQMTLQAALAGTDTPLTIGELLLTAQRVRPVQQGAATTLHAFTQPATLRDYVRENPFRSLATAHGLPQDWQVEIQSPEQLHAVVETIYPGLIADWAASDGIQVQPLNAVIARQVGMFAELNPDAIATDAVIAAVCAGCVRHPTWHTGTVQPLPCREACNHWLSAAYEQSHKHDNHEHEEEPSS